ncbi:alpha/beta fold hydrolase [Vallitalea okinawensis]|uniref:alpha/beta fold hydrolase n=1 Tax=Vallitalea okinawensis TaxID=2078660 RepID=UPI000CFAE3CA|nr:alpha/beta hydrolase [Vallitalea okinawensis]
MDYNWITLKDGRKMAYKEYGNANGKPLILVHGTPFSKLMWRDVPGVLDNEMFRIIAVDRPGYGHSDYNINGYLDNFPFDILELMDYLGIDKVSIAGVSGGGPSTLMCALKIPNKLKNVALISSVGPFVDEAIGDMNVNKKLYKTARMAPWIIYIQTHFLTKMIKKDPVKFITLGKKKLRGPDLEALEKDNFYLKLAEAYSDGCRQETSIKHNAMSHDIMHTANWKIPLKDINKTVHVFWGGKDRSIGDQCQYMAQILPNAITHFYPDEGHFLVYHKMSDVFKVL